MRVICLGLGLGAAACDRALKWGGSVPSVPFVLFVQIQIHVWCLHIFKVKSKWIRIYLITYHNLVLFTPNYLYFLHCFELQRKMFSVSLSLSCWFIAHISWRIYEIQRNTLTYADSHLNRLSVLSLCITPVHFHSVCLYNRIFCCRTCTLSIFHTQNFIFSFESITLSASLSSLFSFLFSSLPIFLIYDSILLLVSLIYIL